MSFKLPTVGEVYLLGEDKMKLVCTAITRIEYNTDNNILTVYGKGKLNKNLKTRFCYMLFIEYDKTFLTTYDTVGTW